MNEDKATRYHRLRRRVAVAAVASSGGALALVVASGASAGLARAATRITAGLPAAEAVATVLFSGTLAAVVLGCRFPLDRFRESTLERRYGLEREPVAAWTRAWWRRAAVALALASLAALALRACGTLAGGRWWMPASVLFWTSQVGWTVAAPIVLMTFGGLRPLRRQGLAERLRDVARRTGTAIDVLEWRGGDDSRRAHAALAGIGRTRRVILSDTLLDTLTEPEVEVVVAHELAHHVHADVWRAAAWRLVAIPLAFAVAADALVRLRPPAAGLPLEALPIVALTAGAAHLLLLPIGHALSRHSELAADAFALEVTGNVDAFVSSMRRLSANNLIDPHPPLLARLYSSHPTVSERVLAALRQQMRHPGT